VDGDAARPSGPGYVVDSILPPDEALRRFRDGLSQPVHLDGPPNRDQLVRRFFSVLRRRDRAALEALAIDRAEFAYLVYPELRTSRPPYRQLPDVTWLMLRANSDGGRAKLLQRALELDPISYRCARPAETEGQLRVWNGCLVRARYGGRVRHLRLFGAIIERNGRFKFAGFDTDF
jgi:hypothetical protein